MNCPSAARLARVVENSALLLELDESDAKPLLAAPGWMRA